MLLRPHARRAVILLPGVVLLGLLLWRGQAPEAQPETQAPSTMGTAPAARVPTATRGTSTAAAASSAGTVLPAAFHPGAQTQSSTDVPASTLASSLTSTQASSSQAPERVRLLDGGMGEAPAAMMKDCTYDGGFRCGECTHDAECPSGQGCTIDRSIGRFVCVSAECEDDQGCFPGTVCRVVTADRHIKRCVHAGTRAEGETCSAVPASPGEACREDLRCVAGRCGTACTPGARDACPAGMTCEGSDNGGACIPDCRQQGCASGKQCLAVRRDTYRCVTPTMDACSDTRPCADGQSCLVFWRGGTSAGRFCAAPCASWRTDSCPAGFVCGRGGPTGSACYRACDLRDLSTCPAGWLCRTVSEDLSVTGCTPDL